MEEIMPGIVGSLSRNTSSEALAIRQLPDFVIQNRNDGSLHYVEVKYRHDGSFNRKDLPKDFKYTNAFFIIVHKSGIGCISFNNLTKIGHFPKDLPFTLYGQQQFVLSSESINEFEEYAKMIFVGVE